MKKKICLIASSGGHFEQLLSLKKLGQDFDIYFITEKTSYFQKEKRIYLVEQINRREKLFVFKLLIVSIQSLIYFLKEKPDYIVSTGALAAIPTFLLGKFFRKKLIFIESFAKVSTPTMTGKLVYKFVDVFIIQWKSLKQYYPNAIYLGSIY